MCGSLIISRLAWFRTLSIYMLLTFFSAEDSPQLTSQTTAGEFLIGIEIQDDYAISLGCTRTCKLALGCWFYHFLRLCPLSSVLCQRKGTALRCRKNWAPENGMYIGTWIAVLIITQDSKSWSQLIMATRAFTRWCRRLDHCFPSALPVLDQNNFIFLILWRDYYHFHTLCSIDEDSIFS